MATTLGEGCIIEKNGSTNTGFENDCALGLAAGVIIAQRKLRFTKEQMADVMVWLNTGFHAAPRDRFYPVFAGINDFAFARESNTTETNNIKRTTRIIATGGYTFTYTWEKGGMCLADKLKGFQGKDYGYIPFDGEGKFAMTDNHDGTFSPIESTDVTSDFLPQLPSASAKNVLVFTTPYHVYVGAKIFNSSGSTVDNLMGLIDTEIYKAADTPTPTAGTGATRTITISALGTNGDTINLKDGSGVSLTGAVTQTSSESTPTILATKVKNAGNAATSTNGGYTYTSTGAVITEIAPASLGATVNGSNVVPTVVGSIGTSQTIFAGGVSQSGKIIIGVRTECAKTDLVAEYGADLADHDLYVVTDNIAPTVPITMTAALNAGKVELSGRLVSGHTYTAIGSAPTVWLSKDIEGYDASVEGAEFLIP